MKMETRLTGLRLSRVVPALLVFLHAAVIGIAETSVSEQVDDHLELQQFSQALALAKGTEDVDQLFGRIALAQFDSGDEQGARNSLRQMASGSAFQSATQEVRSRRAARGGATGADFDTLINLITSTVAPESWDDVGGPGAIVEFPGGIEINTDGVLSLVESSANIELEHFRNRVEAKIPPAAGITGNPRSVSRQRMVSLSRLQQEVQLRQAFGDEIDDAMKHFAGLRRVDFVFFFPTLNECVIAGPAADWDKPEEFGPPLLLDDFVVLLKNARQANGRFGCSITPKQQHLATTQRYLVENAGELKPGQTKRWVQGIRDSLGLQDIEVFGIDPRTHVAHVLVESDYHMKLIGMGLQPSVAGVPSYLDSVDRNNMPATMDVLRWWFTLQEDVLRKSERGDVYQFVRQTARLLSENEKVTAAGQRRHTGASSELNSSFAQRFTKHFGQLAAEYPIYAQLEGLFRLSLVAALLDSPETGKHVDWDTNWWITTLSPAMGAVPKEVASIVNHRSINRRHVVVGVSGGVTVNASVIKDVKPVKIPILQTNWRQAAPRLSRDSQRWWWD